MTKVSVVTVVTVVTIIKEKEEEKPNEEKKLNDHFMSLKTFVMKQKKRWYKKSW